MIGISGVGRGGALRAGSAVKAGSHGFTVQKPAATPAGSVGSAAAIGPVGLIALQEDDRPHVRDRKARRGGELVLEALDRLRLAALDTGSEAALAGLDQAVGQMTEAADPVLRGLIGAIRLRARVELARRAA